MNEQWILHGLQLVLVMGMLAMGWLYTRHLRANNLNWLTGGWKGFLIGFVTDFGDTIGVGSFATTTAAFKMTNYLDDDRDLPGTINAVHAIPTMVEAIFFLTAVQIDWPTFIVMTIASILGALIGPRLTAHWDAQKIRRALAYMLVLAALVMIYNIFFLPDPSVAKHALVGWQLWVGALFNFTLGILMTLGLGNYTPELIFFSLMGMSPLVAFPVMMVNSAAVMSTAALGFVKTHRLQWRGLGSIILGGIVGVVLAATLVKNIDMTILRYGIVILSLWTAYGLFKETRNVAKAAAALQDEIGE
ncbi:sulfite exporter TauE/SafE family protein [Weissella kandleri]|nr:sulfite exporter TauE/SafE family protein [Weissella kandleri]